MFAIRGFTIVLLNELNSCAILAWMVNENNILIDRVLCNDITGTSRAIAAGADVNIAVDSPRMPLLSYAVIHGNYNIVRLLLEKGASVTTADEYGNTPLHWASYHGHLRIAQLLLRKHAPVNIADIYRQTPLHLAADHRGIVRLLLKHGADPNATDDRRLTPLNCAEIAKNQEVIALLKSASVAGKHCARRTTDSGPPFVRPPTR